MTRNGRIDPSVDEGESPTDKSHLFMVNPSANSTDQPSQKNLSDYGTSIAPSDSAASFEVLLPREGGGKRGMFKKVTSCVHRAFSKRPTTVVGLLLIATCLLAFLGSTALRSSSGGIFPGAGKDLLDAEGRPTFSVLDPVKELGLFPLSRPEASGPPHSVLSESRHKALPTNAWYQNMLMAKGEPTDVHRVYTMPYVLDATGPIPGLRTHPNHMDGSTTVVQLSFVDNHGITLGAAASPNHSSTSQTKESSAGTKAPSKRYSVVSATSLAVNLKWSSLPMTASIVKGMPYTTMQYPMPLSGKGGKSMLPTIASEIDLEAPPVADGNTEIKCSAQHTKATRVEKELALTFQESDFTWLVFFSEPVMVKCIKQPEGIDSAAVILQIVDVADPVEPIEGEDIQDLTVRAALLTNCTNGVNQLFCRSRESLSYTEKFAHLLRKHAHLHPGPNADVRYDIDNENDRAILSFDWDVQDTKTARRNDMEDPVQSQLRRDTSSDVNPAPMELITFALPHHLHRMSADFMPWEHHFCSPTLIGTSCIVSGSVWELIEDMPRIGFRASRPPRPEALAALSTAVKSDLPYKLHGYYERGAGDTYFSGKMLARIGRVLVIAEELTDLCTPNSKQDMGYVLNSSEAKLFSTACQNVTLPTTAEMSATLDRLRSSVEIWINGSAVTPFVYDSGWGGVISCGCQFNDKTKTCDNVFPECPSIEDPGMNFGNGFYNDHHFHYGYHIYAAAVLAHFDKAWGRKHFEQVLLLVRDIANPSNDDVYFPTCRHKDWYQGNSWASGVPLPPYPNGKNQESSSEAIASYEAVALFGREMMAAWKEGKDEGKVKIAAHVRDVGRLLTATEVRAADYYWHVRQHNETMKIYPSTYKENAVGMLWNTMAQFQTWFGSARYLAYGIQLLPLTAISESRDDPGWMRELYQPFAESCDADDVCTEQGWSILQMAVLASVGHRELAFEKVGHLKPDVFDTAGGNGHSLTNTLWYVATRPAADPIELPESDLMPITPPKDVAKLVDCGIPDKCTDEVLDTDAKGSTCRERISWLIAAMGYTEEHACHKVAGGEFTRTCGLCDPGPDKTAESGGEESQCPRCSREQCLSDLNRCPNYENSYVCTDGPNRGGCSPAPWDLGSLCHSCCETTDCSEYIDFEEPDEDSSMDTTGEKSSSCIQCDEEVCTDKKINLCPVKAAPFLCVKGKNAGGCSPEPWRTDDKECEKCCDLKLTCGNHE